jgi:hypothetical protein
MRITFHTKSFEGHAGRPGERGGSQPRDSAYPEENYGNGPQKVDRYTESLRKVSKAARDLGIPRFPTAKRAEEFATEAVDIINTSRKPVGYTVYRGSTANMLETEDLHDGYFPTVEYGSGESKGAVNKMMRILQDAGYAVTIGPENYGIIVGIRGWKSPIPEDNL